MMTTKSKMKINQDEYKEYLQKNGYSENGFTLWKFVHRTLTNYAIGKMFSLPECNLMRWQMTEEDELPKGVSALFRVMNKVDLMGVDTSALF